jgi:hypothetical protein
MFNQAKQLAVKFLADEGGDGGLNYVVVVAIIVALVATAAATVLGPAISRLFATSAGKLDAVQ